VLSLVAPPPHPLEPSAVVLVPFTPQPVVTRWTIRLGVEVDERVEFVRRWWQEGGGGGGGAGGGGGGGGGGRRATVVVTATAVAAAAAAAAAALTVAPQEEQVVPEVSRADQG